MSNQHSESTGAFLTFTSSELATKLAQNLDPLIREQINQILEAKTEDDSAPMTFEEAAEWLKISRSTLSSLVGKGEIPYTPLLPDNPKSKKYFSKKILREWSESKMTKTIDELKDLRNGKS
jgi:hypothetical protein